MKYRLLSAPATPPPPDYRRVEKSSIAYILSAIAILECVAAPIIGIAFGRESASLGWLVFLCFFIGGLALLGSASLIESAYECSQRLRHIEHLIQKKSDNNDTEQKRERRDEV